MQGNHTYWFMKETENIREYAIILILMGSSLSYISSFYNEHILHL